MPLSPLAPVDTRPLFRPVTSEFVTLLRGLPADAWARPTIAGSWLVRDVVAHLIDLMLRRVSFHRDRMVPPPPPRPIASARDFTEFINGLNAQWVDAARRLSPQVLTDLLAKAGGDLSDWFEALPMHAPALFGVSWAGEQESAGWFDVGREFAEIWHHQQQVRLAVDAPPLGDPRYLRATLEISVRALPYAYQDVPAEQGTAVVLHVTGAAGGTWTLVREAGRWDLQSGETDGSTVRVTLAEEDVWRLLFNALPEPEAARAAVVHGPRELAAPLFRARSVIV